VVAIEGAGQRCRSIFSSGWPTGGVKWANGHPNRTFFFSLLLFDNSFYPPVLSYAFASFQTPSATAAATVRAEHFLGLRAIYGPGRAEHRWAELRHFKRIKSFLAQSKFDVYFKILLF
jgi:hypothetical protein